MQIDGELGPLVEGWNRPRLDTDSGVAISWWADGRLAYYNDRYETQGRTQPPGWLDRWGLGCSVWDAMAGPIGERIREASDGVLQSRRHWQTSYPCPTPDLHRRMTVRLYPLQRRAVLAVHALQVSEPVRTGAPTPPLDDSYRDEFGQVVQCAGCRHVRRMLPDSGEHWEFVPALLGDPPTTISHTLCHTCMPHWGYRRR